MSLDLLRTIMQTLIMSKDHVYNDRPASSASWEETEGGSYRLRLRADTYLEVAPESYQGVTVWHSYFTSCDESAPLSFSSLSADAAKQQAVAALKALARLV